MSTLAGPLLILGGLLLVYWLVLRPRSRGGTDSFSARRARVSAKSVAGGNALLMLSAVNLAGLAYDLAKTAGTTKLDTQVVSVVIVACLIGALLLLVASHSIAEVLIGVIGYGAALVGAGIQYGAAGVLSIIVLSIIMLWFLGLVRGFVP